MLTHLFAHPNGIALVGLLALAVFLTYHYSRKSRMPYSKLDQRDSLEILKIRLASGEINAEEFNKLKHILMN